MLVRLEVLFLAEGIIEKNRYVVETLSFLKHNPQWKLILLTHAPRIWAQQVLSYLGVEHHFESIYSGDQHGQKNEVFTLIASRYKPENIISVGDQYETDIKPAEELGIRTILVRSPGDIKDLLKLLI